jgi:hypothetical protein
MKIVPDITLSPCHPLTLSFSQETRMSIYDDDWGAVDTPRRVSRVEQAQTGLAGPLGQGRYVAAPASRPPILTPSTDPYAPYAGTMDEVKLIFHADPVARGKALFYKTLGISLFLWGLTLAALALMEGLSFFVWLLWASLEGSICFMVLAYLDWREHPMSVRSKLANGFLRMMRREQTTRQVALYGIDVVRQARELEQ